MPGGRSTGRRTALERLLASRREQFVREHWGQRPLLVSASERGADEAELFSPAAVDELLTRRGLRTPFLRMAQSGSTLADREFTTGGGVGAGIGDQVDEDAVRRRFAAGATIVLQGLHRTWAPIADLAGEVAEELGHPVQVNAYVTPPGNQGFSAHYDVHDVFVLQVHGAKAWRVHPPVWPHPLRDQPWEDRKAAVAEAAGASPLLEPELRPGDLLYLPRGYLHSAMACSEVSIHLTIGIHTWTRAHLLDALWAEARRGLAEDPGLRASLPVGVDVTTPEHLSAEAAAVRAALARAVAAVPDQALADSLRARARAGQRPAPVPVLAQAAAANRLAPGDVLRLRPGLVATLEQSPPPGGADQVTATPAPGQPTLAVRSRAGRCPVPTGAREAVARLLAGSPVAVAEFAPDDADAALAVGRRLLVEGVALMAKEAP